MDKPSYKGDGYYQDSVVVVSKGLKLEVVRILSLYTVIDLSNNKFEGHIPGILGDLIAIRVLNLSHNGLQGPIPPSLGSLSVVESLDLSFNHLSGEIPQQLASLTSLEFLNLSHNYLQGCIPQGPQFRTFEGNSYEARERSEVRVLGVPGLLTAASTCAEVLQQSKERALRRAKLEEDIYRVIEERALTRKNNEFVTSDYIYWPRELL
uniref:Hcr2-0A n=1 Tax=Solanum tuberosum TaxID=4113 RepID=M1AL80_SOLTU